MDLVMKDIDIENDEYVVVGVSSGPDSMALLHLLKTNLKAKLVCAHINHNVRASSDEEADYLKSYCEKFNIIFECQKIEHYDQNNFEAEAREKRYAFYELILKKYHSHHLFLAHHGIDLIETVLMKIIRGSNLEGYAGIKMYSKVKDYTIIRPLLTKTKKDILKYNESYNIKYYLDKTNEDTTYTRNRIRQNIVPLIQKEDKLAHLKFLKYSNTLTEYYNYVEDITKDKLKKNYPNNTIQIDIFKEEHHFIQKNIIFYILSNIYNNQANIIKDKHIENIINLSNSKKPCININLPKNYLAKKTYNQISFEKKVFHPETNNNYKLELKEINKFDNLIIQKVDYIDTDGNNVCRLNSKDIHLPLYLRSKLDGDYMYVLGLNGKKKVKDIFIDSKVPKDIRNNYPILVDSLDNILWIPNIKKSKYNVKNNQFCDIILTSYKEREEHNEEKK